jgi:hypothetical protein
VALTGVSTLTTQTQLLLQLDAVSDKIVNVQPEPLAAQILLDISKLQEEGLTVTLVTIGDCGHKQDVPHSGVLRISKRHPRARHSLFRES